MKALVTGASSGIGRCMAQYLAKKNIDLIVVARRQDKLEELKQSLNVDVEVIVLDLSKTESCFTLYETVKDKDIDILINNAGFGVCGEFLNTDINKELNMINTNINALHILTKLFLKDFVSKNRGYILNVASSAAFLPGPLLSSYYASKAYVLRLDTAINTELKKMGSDVIISTLCPGPVDTEFDRVADVKFSMKGMSAQKVAEYAIDKMFKKKNIIIPSFLMKFLRPFQKITPENILSRIAYKIQHKKTHKK